MLGIKAVARGFDSDNKPVEFWEFAFLEDVNRKPKTEEETLVELMEMVACHAIREGFIIKKLTVFNVSGIGG